MVTTFPWQGKRPLGNIHKVAAQDVTYALLTSSLLGSWKCSAHIIFHLASALLFFSLPFGLAISAGNVYWNECLMSHCSQPSNMKDLL